jgi:hypothetical protein
MAPALPEGPEPEDPLLTEHVERALAPYRALLPPEALAGFREMLQLFYTTNPVASRALSELRKAPVVDESGELHKRDDAALEAAAKLPPRRRAPGGAR